MLLLLTSSRSILFCQLVSLTTDKLILGILNGIAVPFNNLLAANSSAIKMLICVKKKNVYEM